MRVKDLMTRAVVCVKPGTAIERVHDVMIRRGVRHLPVVENGKLLGILSDRDLLLRADLKSDGMLQYPDATAGDVMSRNLRTCHLTDPVSLPAALMVENRIDCIPVVDGKLRLLGILTSLDLMAVLSGGQAVTA